MTPMSGLLKFSCAVLSARWAMVTGSSGSPSTSSRVPAEAHAQPSDFLPCHLFWLVVRHDNDDHRDGIVEGMKRKTALNIGNMLNL